MRVIRLIYRTLYIIFTGHLPRGELVRFDPYNSTLGFYLREDGDPEIGEMGIVIGGWEIDRFPDHGLSCGSLVLFSNGSHKVENWELTVLDETDT